MNNIEEYIRENFHYSPETGILYRKFSSYWRECGTINAAGYLAVGVCDKDKLVHQIGFFLMMGRWAKEIDHIDRNKSNNIWINLRECTASENKANSTKQSNNTSGYKGVYWHKRANKFRAQIQFQKKLIHIGLFDTAEEAAAAYNTKAIELNGEFAGINIIKQ